MNCKWFDIDEDEYMLDEYDTIEEEEIVEEFKLKYNKITGIISSNETRVPGGDDKCGIALALQLAMEYDGPLKLLFTISEEIGCVGIASFCKTNADWFKDVLYSITLDRRGTNELLLKSSGDYNCSFHFASMLLEQGFNAGIWVEVEQGTIADLIYIRDYVNETVNLSVGYKNPHSEDETIDFFAMIKIKQWIWNIVKNITPEKMNYKQRVIVKEKKNAIR